MYLMPGGLTTALLILSYILVSMVVLSWYNFSEFRGKTKHRNQGYLLKDCNCLKHREIPDSPRQRAESTCSDESSWYGRHQKVISFSLYEPKEDSNKPFHYLLNSLRINLRQIQKYYPEWVVRVYTDITLNEDLCEFACLDELFWCDIRESSVPFLNITNARVWRFTPLGDDTVDIFLSRDIESLIILREKEVVSDWEFLSDKPFHAMRDDEFYPRPVLAGQWGAKNTALGWYRAKELRSIILEAAQRSELRDHPTADEDILEKQLYNFYWPEFLQHESYMCEHWQGSIPYPRQRANPWVRVAHSIRGVGRKRFKVPCPIACRPLNGQNWTYC